MLSAGGQKFDWSKRLATIYTPGYFYDSQGNLAVRPVIDSAPDRIGYSQYFSICTANPQEVDAVCLMKPGAVTHGFNQDQRYVPLWFQDCSDPMLPDVLTVQGPPEPDWAPPGDYMLFILKDSVPSLAHWVRLSWDWELAQCPTCGGGGEPRT